jgi:hypothetical protein
MITHAALLIELTLVLILVFCGDMQAHAAVLL